MKYFINTLFALSLLVLVSCSENSSTPNNDVNDNTDNQETGKEIGDVLPDFSLQDSEGNIFQLSDYRGEVLLFEYWQTTCHICEEKMPGNIALQEKYQNKNFKFVTIVTAWENKDNWKLHLDRWNMGSLLNLQDANGVPINNVKQSVQGYFDIIGTPYYFMVGPEGKLLYKGFHDDQMFENHIQENIE